MDAQRKAHGPNVGRGTSNTQHAVTYLDSIKAEFRDRPDIYDQFLVIMKEFKKDEISTSSVIQRVAELFKGHPSLIQGFNVFLPAGISMNPTGSEVGPGSLLHTTTKARSDRLDDMYSIIRFAEKIRQRCTPETYDQFLNVLSLYHHRMHDIDQEGAVRQIKTLLHNEQDLYSQFQFFLGENIDTR